ncbi:MAG TPA: glycosyltransferase family 2 protein [Candidatus Omnitrophota bacterium]|nr:glycosyltransferase family 2 protein [Candidatus Omnitrophota bacterium]
MSAGKRTKRFLEILPGSISWGIIIFLVVMTVWRPVIAAVIIIIFDFYWIIRTVYLTTLLVLAHRRLSRERSKDWLAACRSLPKRKWEDLYHLVIFPVYKEGLDILRPSLEALKTCHYPKSRIIVVMAFERRHAPAGEYAKILEAEFGGTFGAYLTTFHPDQLPGEKRLKGANATWAARKAKDLLEQKKIPLAEVIVSCFDADTCIDREYFGCLAYHFLTNPKPHQASYQPVPVYNNNIWQAPSLARIIEISASFCQMIESLRLEKFVTFSSHSMSFKTLVDIDYWPVDMISDDSVVYWKAFLYYKGDYRVIPLYTTVSMDVAYGKNLFKTLEVQYKQKRRWAWGVENFPFVVSRLLRDHEIPLVLKIRRSFHLLESHVTWALWAIIMGVMPSLPLLVGGVFFAQTPISQNLPRVIGVLLNFTLGTSIVWILLSRAILPPRPKEVHWITNIVMVVEWLFVPFLILILGSTPALDAQTRLMLAKYMEFSATEKRRTVV